MRHIVITGTQEEPESKKDNEPAMELALTKRSQDSYGLADVLRTCTLAAESEPLTQKNKKA